MQVSSFEMSFDISNCSGGLKSSKGTKDGISFTKSFDDSNSFLFFDDPARFRMKRVGSLGVLVHIVRRGHWFGYFTLHRAIGARTTL